MAPDDPEVQSEPASADETDVPAPESTPVWEPAESDVVTSEPATGEDEVAAEPEVGEQDARPAATAPDTQADQTAEPAGMSVETAAPPDTAVTVTVAAVPAAATDLPVADPATTAAAEAVSPVEVAVAKTATVAVAPAPGANTLVSGKVTWSTMVVDLLTWLGWKPAGLQVSPTSAPVPSFIATWWMRVREQMYGSAPVDPGPTDSGPVDSAPELLWESNFTDFAELQQYWSTQVGRWGASSGEKQYYTDGLQNVSVSDEGYLVIELRQEGTPDNAGPGYDYTSARLVTIGKVSVEPESRIVARMQLPFTKGTLPAFWMVGLEPGHEYDWPRQGEIDIVELPGTGNAADASVWTGNIHGPSAADNTVDVKLHDVNADLGVDLSAGFHEYGIDWYTDRIVWHVDGVVTGEVTQAEYEALGGDWTAFSGEWPHYLILNIALGNHWTGDLDGSSEMPQQMLVDWIRVYSLS